MLTRFAFPVLFSLAGLLMFLLPFTTTNKSEDLKSPPESYLGSNTFSCESDLALSDQMARLTAEVEHQDNLFYLNLWIGGRENRITFVLRDEVIKEKAYELDHPSQRYLSFLYHGKACTYSSDDYYTGMLMIHKYDTAQKIIAGSFEFMAYSTDCDELIRVKNGQFDATYVAY
jgi:hypothetical protein